MKTNHSLTFFLILALIISPAIVLGQKKYDKALMKADGRYDYGDYKKALKELGKFEKKIKGLGPDSKYMPEFYLREARYHWAAGMLNGFEASLDNAEKSAERAFGAGSEDHLRILLEIVDVYIKYGNYYQARVNIQKVLDQSNPEVHSEPLRARSELALATVLTGQGYYNDALKLVQEREIYFKDRLVTREKVTNEEGKEVRTKLSEGEVMARYADFATLATIKARIYGDMGDIDNAYKYYAEARDWIAGEKRYLGEDSYQYIDNQYQFANFKVNNGLDPDELGRGVHKDEGYDRILNKLQKSHSSAHFMAFGIYETLLKQYLINRQHAKYRNLKVEYEKAISKNYSKNSIQQINLDKLDFNSKLEREKTKNLEDRANSLLANTQALPRNHKITIDILDFLYRIAIKERNFGRAEEYLQQVVSIQTNLIGEDAPMTHIAKMHLAEFYITYTNKIPEAETIVQTSFNEVLSKEIKPQHPDYLDMLTSIAALREYQDNHTEAQRLLDQAIKISLMKFRDPEDIEYAKVLEKVAGLQINIGEYKIAQENIDKVLDIYKKKKVKNDEFNLIYLVMAQQTDARLLGIEGYFDEAEDLIKDSQDLLNSAKTLEGYNTFQSMDQLASLYIYLGRYSESKELLSELLKEYIKVYGPTSGKLVDALVNQGQLQMLMGDYSESEKTARRANEIAISVFGESSSKTAPTYLLLGDLYTNIGDYEKAIGYINTAVSIYEKRFGRKHINTAIALSKLGVAQFYNNEPLEGVEKIMLESRETIGITLTNMNPRYAEVSVNLAKVYIQANRSLEAFASLSLAKSIWENITGGGRNSSRNVNVGRIDALAGDVYYLQKNYSKAEEFYIKARDNFRRSLSEKHPEYVKIQSKLSRVYYMQGDRRKAMDLMEGAILAYNDYIHLFFKSLSEREKAKFWNTIKPDFEYYNTLALNYLDSDKSLTGKMYNNALDTKALLLSSSIRVRERILTSGNVELIEEYQNWLEKKELLTKTISLNEEQLAISGVNLPKLTEEVEALERSLSEKSEDFSNGVEEKRITWENVKASLGENQVAIEMIRFRYFDHVFTDSVIYAVLYLKPDKSQKNPSILLLKDGQKMESKDFKFYNNAIQFRVHDTRSYASFWEPIVKEIGTTSTVFLSPDGIYNQINLEAIPVTKDRYVIDNSNIILVSNTKDIFLKSKKSEAITEGEKTALMFGNPVYYVSAEASNNLPQLPGTEIEVNQVRKVLSNKGINSDYFLKDEATEDQIKSVKNPSILHIATHGFFKPVNQNKTDLNLNDSEAAKNPLLQTGLVLTGGGDLLDKTTFNYNIESGILTAYEAMNLNLEGTDLVVLSACETGLGKLEIGEGVYGLQRAFLVAGAKTLVMSMFKVDDQATQKLMINFYNKWMATGNKRQAFIDAKKELRTEYQDPYYWGAFIMIGLD